MNKIDSKMKSIMDNAYAANNDAVLSVMSLRYSGVSCYAIPIETIPGYEDTSRHDHYKSEVSFQYSMELPMCIVSITSKEFFLVRRERSVFMSLIINGKKIDTKLLDSESEIKILSILDEFESVSNEHIANVLNNISEAGESKKLADEKYRKNKIKSQRAFIRSV